MTRPGATLRIPAWVKRLGSLPEQVTQEALAESRDFLRDKARENASKGGARGLRVRSGRLLRSIRTYLKAKPNGGELSLGMVFYGWVHDTGMTIRAKGGGYLHFRTPSGSWAKVRQVVLPERRWARDALDETRKQFPRYLYRALERATRPG
ncbi:hypothetical protein L1280_002788 [Deinococcus sp. HSC-46F16]|uniref:hypothetical protein n=1 Tax=Deinococcus sp. HSC-46F16 TaxID=2910968 RepID=UPI00209F99A0|nr:hypothetical protein [Deinococcus sp. HSC-46F16]MCP2015620.1 hypothetical protein [Deinococcus sp. HSC-46F16]